MNKLELAICIILFLAIIAISFDNRYTTKKVREFNEKLLKFERMYFSETFPEEPRFMDEKSLEYFLPGIWEQRLIKLNTCYKCPLYQKSKGVNNVEKFYR